MANTHCYPITLDNKKYFLYENCTTFNLEFNNAK